MADRYRMPVPLLRRLANVQHLATRLEGRLSSPPASIVELVCVLHPTPAVCGRPRDEALALTAQRLAFTADVQGPAAVGAIGSAKLSNEAAYLLQKLMRGLVGTNNVDHCARL